MQSVSKLNDNSIKQILTRLDEERYISSVLPHGGFLHLDQDLPFLLVYRKRENNVDPGTERLVKSAASYLTIGTENLQDYKKLLYELGNKLSIKFNSFLIIEIYSGEANSDTFIIKGPAEKISTTLDILKEELECISGRKFGVHLDAKIKNSKSRQAENAEALMTIEEAKATGSLLLGIEIPPAYRNDSGQVFPVFLRHFRDLFIKAIQKAVFDFIRVQTSSGFVSYNALGKRQVQEEVYQIDKHLTEIESSYQFLLVVAPVNIQQIKKKFFESNFEEVLNYHYRLLPIDPDLLKRRLYNLRIDEIDDPALSYLFYEKRKELDRQITLMNERGTRNFYFNSTPLYQEVDSNLRAIAENILKEVPEEVETEDLIDAKEFSALARKEFDYFHAQDENFKSQVHIRNDINILMVSNGELFIPSDYQLTRTGAKGLIQHEIGTHVLTNYNGKQQPFSQMSVGFANYDPLQEGLAVLSEYLIGGLTANRLRILAGRVIAGAKLQDGGDFKSVFNTLHTEYGFSKDPAFNITSRILQGGGFLKDIIYLKGLVQLIDHIKNGGDLEPFYMGKFALNQLNLIKELRDREILKPAALKPRYLESELYNSKISKIREGISFSQLIEK